jgi:ABC-type methionine transport system ATPase subunit
MFEVRRRNNISQIEMPSHRMQQAVNASISVARDVLVGVARAIVRQPRPLLAEDLSSYSSRETTGSFERVRRNFATAQHTYHFASTYLYANLIGC